MEENKVTTKGESTAEAILRRALDVGSGMLKNGGEVSRVENTVARICRAWGAEHVEVFSIISVIHASVHMPDGTRSTQMRRILATGTAYGINLVDKYYTRGLLLCLLEEVADT